MFTKEISIDKLDANKPTQFYSFEKKFTQQNRYDKFSVLQNLSPGKEFFNVTMPDYVTLTYEFTIWTSYIEQMNQIVEKINYSDGAYWGEPGKMRFRTQIESFSDASQIDGEKLIQTTFSVNLYGYILPETFDGETTTQKYLTPKKLIIKEDADTEFLKGDTSSGTSATDVTFKDVFGISVGNSFILSQGTGVTISNSGQSFDGSTALTQQISIGQPVAPTDSVTFNQVTASGAFKIGEDSTVYTETGISGSIDITGSFATTGDLTVQGDTTIAGTLTENAVKTFIDTEVGSVQTYLRKNFFKSSASVTNATTASFTAVTASAPTGYTATSENDCVFFINGQYMEHNALAIQQKGSSLELHVATGSIGYILESDDEILSIGKFNS